jgi:hypothetical protein
VTRILLIHIKDATSPKIGDKKIKSPVNPVKARIMAARDART